MLLAVLPYCSKDALEVCMRADLQYWHNCWFWGLAASGAVVLLGVACEYAEVKQEFKNWFPTHLWYRTFFPKYFDNFTKKEERTWVPFLGVVGFALISIGLAGEILCEVFVFSADNQIVVFEGHVMDEARRETSAAFERAALAETEVSGFQILIAQANARAAEANRIAESEKLERIRLESIVAPRSFTLDQQRRIADTLRKFQGHAASVVSYSTDAEASGLASQIVAVLRSAGVPAADNIATVMPVGGFETGVHVRAPSEEKDFSSAIADALSSIGHLDVASPNDPVPKFSSMRSGGEHFTDPKIPVVTITVGIKPVPILPPK